MSKRESKNWTAEQKLQAVIETGSMSAEDLGAYLRKNGLHSTDLDGWKKQIADAFGGSGKKPKGRPRKDPELVSALEENKQLKRDLRRKEKALAEQTTLVMLQKKAREIWAKYEDDES
jgi:transposase-like protein